MDTQIEPTPTATRNVLWGSSTLSVPLPIDGEIRSKYVSLYVPDFNPALNVIIDAINVGGSNLQALVEAGLVKKFIDGLVDARGAMAIVQFNDIECGKRLFDQDTQATDSHFLQERAHIHQITMKLLLVDGHFFKRMVRGKRDRTVTLFVHYLMKATSATEYGAFVEFLSAVLPHTEDVMTPSVSDLTATLRIFGNVRKGSNDCLVSFFKKLGAGLPSIQSDPRFSLKLFEVIGGLWNFITVDDRAWNLCPSLVAQLPVILSLAQPFWKNLYTLLSTLAHQYQDISSEDSFSRASNDVGIYNMIRRCHKPLTTTLQKGRDRDASVLVVAFIQAGVFSFLDSVVSCLSFEAGHGLFADNRTATGEGSHFFFVGVFLNDILTVCETYPDAISTLRPYLPLPRLLRTSLDAVYAHNAHPPPTEITDVTKLDLRALAWYSLARLQQMCTVRGECQARGCMKSGKLYRCKGCFTMLYCGTECQIRDWKEHKLVCGFLLHPTSASEVAYSLRMPTRFRQYDPSTQ
ncbi:uncharacterized protein STEHIDRAFT_109596 [Stereum hirsutum FP-91666 SS1]|uniref:uncharacterized protein n=1 Tax=Stereum hirsutum (strain FP-91666) TaxID=721885 RepID=UPI000440D6B2|nr:uncharacterized protein STEHIDRAFT_109596 [Stereum hirsutum FP-91666 SS1]EIM89409.1 hypothetical protein STEHIDRAFT_109596 [Stereum hirsutum FP-91666 SS1]